LLQCLLVFLDVVPSVSCCFFIDVVFCLFLFRANLGVLVHVDLEVRGCFFFVRIMVVAGYVVRVGVTDGTKKIRGATSIGHPSIYERVT